MAWIQLDYAIVTAKKYNSVKLILKDNLFLYMKILVKERSHFIPSIYSIVQDLPTQNREELALHFNDVYKLYLRRLSDFEINPEVDEKTENELASILSELITVKRKLQGEV